MVWEQDRWADFGRPKLNAAHLLMWTVAAAGGLLVMHQAMGAFFPNRAAIHAGNATLFFVRLHDWLLTLAITAMGVWMLAALQQRWTTILRLIMIPLCFAVFTVAIGHQFVDQNATLTRAAGLGGEVDGRPVNLRQPYPPIVYQLGGMSGVAAQLNYDPGAWWLLGLVTFVAGISVWRGVGDLMQLTNGVRTWTHRRTCACGYDVRVQIETGMTRCPECGQGIRW